MTQRMRGYWISFAADGLTSILTQQATCLANLMTPSIRTPSVTPLNESDSESLRVLQGQGWSIRWCLRELSAQTVTIGLRLNATILSPDGSKLDLELRSIWTGAEPKLDAKVGLQICGEEDDTYPVSGPVLRELERKLADNLIAIKYKLERKVT